ncbi:AT-rich interactive domain-containing protein 6-like isoform X1 [Cynara cardunculus var. scolymus]|uniref:AT-rich interactive domain-containing protein 6-like isoform X1 n=1 Tax=Cynara cardunculus var. scolymus TaxID=59895 RepID=UPI000D6230A8|nr:AT-rich interactive domain-containing protein 6-like isoform X1 [Cynara cardunculus var. scolymus]
MVLEEDQEQDQPNDNGLKSAGDNRSDEKGLGDVAVESPDDAKNVEDDDKTSGIDGVANQLHSVVVGPGENVTSLDTEVLVEKQDQLDNGGEYRFPSPSPSPTGSGSGNGGSKDDEAEDEEHQGNPERLLVTKTEVELSPDMEEEKLKPEGLSVTKIESELLRPEGETREEEAMEDDDETELNNFTRMERPQAELDAGHEEGIGLKTLQNQKSFLLEPNSAVEDESGTEEDQAAFMKELEIFHKERCLEFKPPRFYGEPLNCLKLWRSVIRLGGYEQVTSCKLWRQVGESFKPPKTCTTVSWTFRCFYEKALLEYEKYKMSIGELPFTDASSAEPASGGKQANLNQTPGSGRARRDAAARAMQGWHSQRLLGNGEVGDPIIKDKTSSTTLKRDKQNIGLLKRKKPSSVERAVKVARMKASKPQLDSMVVDIGPPADWVKINVQRTKDCFEVYALVPGLLREEVRVQSDPAGRLVISGQPEQLDNPWGVSPFKKVVSLPSRIDPHQTSAVVTLHGQLFVRVPFEQSEL